MMMTAMMMMVMTMTMIDGDDAPQLTISSFGKCAHASCLPCGAGADVLGGREPPVEAGQQGARPAALAHALTGKP
jgi:hypothetical protein